MKRAEEAETWQEAIQAFNRAEHAQRERDRSNGMIFSLDDPIERTYVESHCDSTKTTPERIVIRQISKELLITALETLPQKQQKRIVRYFWGSHNYSEVARREGVTESSVRRSIGFGLARMHKELRDSGITAGDFTEYHPTRYRGHFRKKKETTDRQTEAASFINIYGVPEKSNDFLGEESTTECTSDDFAKSLRGI